MAFISPDTIIRNSCYFSNLVSFKILKATTYTKSGASWEKSVDHNTNNEYQTELKVESVNDITHKPKITAGGIKCCFSTFYCDEPGNCGCIFGDTSTNPWNLPCNIENENDKAIQTRSSVQVSIKSGSGATGRCAVNYKEEKSESFLPCVTNDVELCECADFDSSNAKLLMGSITDFKPKASKLNRSFNGVKGANSTYNSPPPLPSKGKTATALISPLCYSLGETTINYSSTY